MIKDTAWLEPIMLHQQELAMEALALQYDKMARVFNPKNPIAHQRAVEDANYCRVMVTDTGIGIAPDRLTCLFDLQKNKSTPGLFGEIGNGFGLILVHDLVEKNGGTIHAESTLGKGTSFTFTLPIDEPS